MMLQVAIGRAGITPESTKAVSLLNIRLAVG
jgi:hypothetical protein